MYNIIGILNDRIEILDNAEDYENAEYLREEYQIAFGNNWIIEIERG